MSDKKTASKTKKHHYVSVCYLKNFATPRERHGRIYSLNKENKKQYPTKPNDSGCQNQFNYVDAEGVDPNYLEDVLGQTIENEYVPAFEYINRNHKIPKPKSQFYNVLITMISLFAVRNPWMRNKVEDFEGRIMNQVMELLVSKKEIWEGQTRRMQADGYETGNVTYEQMRDFVQRKEYDLVFPKGYHVAKELKLQQDIFPYFYNRKWELLINEDGGDGFICSNRPVSLVPTTPKLMDRPLGYGLKSTAVIFPLSNELCIAGTFEGKFRTKKISTIEVQEINSFTTLGESRFIYSKNESFTYLTQEGIKNQTDLLDS